MKGRVQPAAESWQVAAGRVSRRYALPDGAVFAALDRVSLRGLPIVPLLSADQCCDS
jgi:hypothetical protein